MSMPDSKPKTNDSATEDYDSIEESLRQTKPQPMPKSGRSLFNLRKIITDHDTESKPKSE